MLLVGSTLFRLGHVELRGEEPRRAVVALEMLDSGEFVVPHLTGAPYYNKPPLFNWAVAASLAAFGGTEAWMVRLPSLVAWWLTGLLTFLVTARLADRRTGLCAMLFYFTSGELLFYGTVMSGELDLFYALVVFLQATSILWFLRRERWLALFTVSWGLAAIGFLTKGMPSLGFQVLTLVAALAGFGRSRRLFDPRHLAGLAIFLAIIGGYLLAYAQRQPVEPLLVALFEEAAQRTGLQSRIGELLWGSVRFPLVILRLLLPWSLLVVWLGRRERWRALWANPWTRFCLLFCAANLPLYWFSGELRNRYVYPFFPFLLAPIAHAFVHDCRNRPALRRWTSRAGQALLVGLVVGAAVVPWIPPFRGMPFIGGVMAAWGSAGLLLVLLYRRRADLRVSTFVLALLVARLAFDLTWLPAMNLSPVSAYPPHVERIVELAAPQPVHLGGPARVLERRAALGPFTLGHVRTTVAPSLAYQVAWHYARRTGRPMVWKESPSVGDYVLVDRSRLAPDVPVLYGFHDHWTGADLALVRWPGTD